jgi:ligand-binding SRPBCC domain-containing protein
LIYDAKIWSTPRRPERVTVFEKQVLLNCNPRQVFDFCCSGENFAEISPDRISPTKDNEGTTVLPDHVFSFHHWMLPFVPVKWVVHIASYTSGYEYVDMQLRGPFRYFRHTHRCSPSGAGTLYLDRVEFRSPFGLLADRFLVSRSLERIFTYRHRRMKELLDGATSGRGSSLLTVESRTTNAGSTR